MSRAPDDPPPGPPSSPAFLLMTVGGRVREQVEEGLRAEGMSLRHLSALGHLARSPGLSYSELARRARITPQSMQATLNALEERGAVARRTDPGRGRTAALQVTDEGDRLRRAGQRVIDAVDEDLRGQLDAGSREDLARALLALMRPSSRE